MNTEDLSKTFNVSGFPHIDSEGNVKAWRCSVDNTIERTGFQVIQGLYKLHRDRDALNIQIAELESYIETATPMEDQ